MTEPCDKPIDPSATTARVMVFIDGQNLYKGLNRRHGVRLHPLLLARELTGPDRHLAGTHYYSGIHDPEVNASMYQLVRRRHDLIRRTGVLVTERTLHYHWEWRVEHDDVPPPWYDNAPTRTKARVFKHRAAREKGIDVALALDAVGSILTDACDVAIIVSRDRDLMEIADEVRSRCKGVRPMRVEVAYVSEQRGDEDRIQETLGGYDGFHEIDDHIIDAARDTFDYGRKLKNADVEQFLVDIGV
ncbi:MAG: NYN domain-containing protein [Acidimicrobiia bacterium]|nr:NYN domain-containing protein [Acidimicrobiia bacterium]